MKLIEKKVEELLREHNIQSVPVRLEEITKKNNIIIRKAPSNEFSGLLFKRENGQSYIAISSNESPVRQRFTLAHELGHFFLHPQKNTFVEFRDNIEFKETKRGVSRSPKEIQANQFAAALLMPKKFLEQDLATFKQGILPENIKSLAQKYDVSSEAMNYRLINLLSSF